MSGAGKEQSSPGTRQVANWFMRSPNSAVDQGISRLKVSTAVTQNLRLLLSRPQRKRLTGFETRIVMIRQIKPAATVRTEMRLIFAEGKPVKGTQIFLALDLHRNEILIS